MVHPLIRPPRGVNDRLVCHGRRVLGVEILGGGFHNLGHILSTLTRVGYSTIDGLLPVDHIPGFAGGRASAAAYSLCLDRDAFAAQPVLHRCISSVD